jgi:hypothetical protein
MAFKVKIPSYLKRDKKKKGISIWLEKIDLNTIMNTVIAISTVMFYLLSVSQIKDNDLAEKKRFTLDSTFTVKKFQADSSYFKAQLDQLSKSVELQKNQYSLENKPMLIFNSLDKIEIVTDSSSVGGKIHHLVIKYRISNLGKIPIQLYQRESNFVYEITDDLNPKTKFFPGKVILMTLEDTSFSSDVISNKNENESTISLLITDDRLLNMFSISPFSTLREKAYFEVRLIFTDLSNNKKGEFIFKLKITSHTPLRYEIDDIIYRYEP